MCFYSDDAARPPHGARKRQGILSATRAYVDDNVSFLRMVMLKPEVFCILARIAFPTVEMPALIQKTRVVRKEMRPNSMSPQTTDIPNVDVIACATPCKARSDLAQQ